MTVEITPAYLAYALLALGIAIGLFFYVVKIRAWMRRRKIRGVNPREIAERWKEIEKMFAHESESSRKLALIEADKLLDEILKTMMMPGETLGERLKSAGYKYEGIREAWFGHKIRNRLVHESAFRLSPGLARDAMRSFKKSFKSLGLL